MTPVTHIELDDDPATALRAHARPKSRAQQAIVRRQSAEALIELRAR